MLDDIFYWIVNMSITGTIVGIILLLLGKFNKIPRRLLHFLWIIPLLRLTIPFSFAGEFNLMSLLSNLGARTVVVYHNSNGETIRKFIINNSSVIDFSQLADMEILGTNFIQSAESYFPIIYKTNLLESIFHVASLVWIIVSLAILLTIFVLYFSTKAELRDARHLCDNIYVSDKISSPAVYGIIKSRILVPEAYAKRDLTYILAHENAHIKRGDNVWRIVAFVIAAIHWFNPFSWFFLKSFLETTELACDEKVLSKYNETERKAYALSLVDCVESKSLFASAFGGAKVRLRIDNILSYRKLSIFATICLVLFAIAVAYVLLTNAR